MWSVNDRELGGEIQARRISNHSSRYSRYGNSGFYGVPLRTRFGRVLHFLTFIFIYIYLISICIYLMRPSLSQPLFMPSHKCYRVAPCISTDDE